MKDEFKKMLKTILVADDDEVIRTFIKTSLERAGYQIVEAIDGEDAIKKFLEHKDNIQLIIIDVIMPKTHGKEVYEAIKKVRPDIKVIFTSGYEADFIFKKEVLEEGLDLILKPFLPKVLLERVGEILK